MTGRMEGAATVLYITSKTAVYRLAPPSNTSAFLFSAHGVTSNTNLLGIAFAPASAGPTVSITPTPTSTLSFTPSTSATASASNGLPTGAWPTNGLLTFLLDSTNTPPSSVFVLPRLRVVDSVGSLSNTVNPIISTPCGQNYGCLAEVSELRGRIVGSVPTLDARMAPSGDNRYVKVACYNGPGSAMEPLFMGSRERVIGRLSASGVFDSTTAILGYAGWKFIGAVTLTGEDYFTMAVEPSTGSTEVKWIRHGTVEPRLSIPSFPIAGLVNGTTLKLIGISLWVAGVDSWTGNRLLVRAVILTPGLLGSWSVEFNVSMAAGAGTGFTDFIVSSNLMDITIVTSGSCQLMKYTRISVTATTWTLSGSAMSPLDYPGFTCTAAAVLQEGSSQMAYIAAANSYAPTTVTVTGGLIRKYDLTLRAAWPAGWTNAGYQFFQQFRGMVPVPTNLTGLEPMGSSPSPCVPSPTASTPGSFTSTASATPSWTASVTGGG